VSCGANVSSQEGTLANMTEPSVCGGDAVLCQISLTTCFHSSQQKVPILYNGYPFPPKIAASHGGGIWTHLIYDDPSNL